MSLITVRKEKLQAELDRYSHRVNQLREKLWEARRSEYFFKQILLRKKILLEAIRKTTEQRS